MAAVFLAGALFASVASASPAIISVFINTSSPVTVLPSTYLGFTLDWWPPSQEDFGTSTILRIDFENPRLRGLSRALGASTLRVGGSLDNIVQYLVSPSDTAWCNRSQTFRGQSYQLCLTLERWSAVLEFASTALAPGSDLVFGLQLDLSENEGAWNSTSVLAFLNATAAMGPAASVAAFEVGEETTPTPGTPQFDSYIGAYRGIRNATLLMWPDASSRPALRGPCEGMTSNVAPFSWMSAFLEAALPAHGDPSTRLVDALVMHSYNNDGGDNWAVPGFLNQTGLQAAGLRSLLTHATAPAFPLICGECGPHNGGGLPNITDTVQSSFWYQDALHGLPLLGASEFARQTLAGASYALLTNDVFEPNPDYFVALAYAQLAGPRVLDVTAGPVSYASSIHVYAHCTPPSPSGVWPSGAVALAWVNIDDSQAFTLDIQGDLGGIGRLEFHFAAQGGDVRSRTLELNGVPLIVTGDEPPPLVPQAVNGSIPLVALPLTFGYAVFPDTAAIACLG